MKVVILGAGIIGVSTAWHLLQNGHEVVLVDRQNEAASETSFANAAQISVSYCEPWANRDAPLKALKWMFSDEAPLLFRPQFPFGEGWHQYAWGMRFLANCNDAAFERNVAQIVALGSYSHAALREVVAQTGIEYERLQKGIAHVFTDERAFAAANSAAQLMARHGVERQVVSTGELLRIEPAFSSYRDKIVGGTYTASDESGDARTFTRELAKRCAAQGAQLLMGHDVQTLLTLAGGVQGVRLSARSSGLQHDLQADAVVVACGSYSAPLLRSVGVNLPVYPGKGYSVTLPLLKPERAPWVSTIDDEKKIAITRLGDQLRVAGTIEVGGFDLSLDTPLAQKRCEMLLKRVETLLPGVADTRTPAQGGNPHYWCGLRPATPTNIPFIGKTKVNKLWVNTGHGTLGWTHGAGSGKALAELISGRKPDLAFQFL
ncbi:MAG: D-amino acid dehydrogenase [Brachymonas sp.]|nr:D-amino acid dehydrogenase [Brachymonas sp.]